MNTSLGANMPEVEGKILDTSPESLREALIKIGAAKDSETIMKAQWLQNTNGSKLRVREEGNIIMVEHKEKNPSNAGIKSYNETGFRAQDFDDVIKTLEKIGMTRLGLPSIKNRVTYLIGMSDENAGAKLDFDTYSSLGGRPIPTFLEIEGTSVEIVHRVAILLGFKISDLRDYGPQELFQHYYPNETLQ